MSADRINPYRMFVGAFIPNWLLSQEGVSQGAKLCYARLCQYAGKDGRAYPSQETLAAELGVKERQVRNYLSELTDVRLIGSERIGLGQTNAYFFYRHEWQDSSAQYGDPLPPVNGKGVPVEENQRRESSDPPPSDQPVDGTPMDRFFKAETVPKRVAALVDLYSGASIVLNSKQKGHLAAVIKRHGHGREVLLAALASFTAVGDRIEYMEKVITNGQTRQRGTRKGASVATEDDLAEAKRWQAERVRRD